MLPIGKWVHPWRMKINYFRHFDFRGRRYKYCMSNYNMSWDNERTVEIPIFLAELKAAQEKGGAVLEIGNVLANYCPVSWRVADKYENAPHVELCDIAEIPFEHRYDLIMSISTIEHVGFDEQVSRFPEQWDETKLLDSIKRVTREGLNAGGKLVVSFPIGYNIKLDQIMLSGQFGAARTFFLRRETQSNKWREVSQGEIKGIHYNDPFYCGNAICIAEFDALA